MMDIAKARLYSQHISGNVCATPEQVVRSLGAVQSQDYAQSLWAIGQRTRNATIADVEKALTDGTLVRTWLLRGTVHIILAEDITWMRNLFSERILARLTPKAWTYHAMTPEIMDQARTIVTEALRGRRAIARKELIKRLSEGGIPDDKQQSYFIFGYLSQTGVLCSGPPQGKDLTFVLADELTVAQRQLSRDESLAVLAERFFTSHGPATIADFANWSALRMADAKAGHAMIQNKLQQVQVNGVHFWMSPDIKEGGGMFLLSAYDEFLIGYKDRSASFEVHGFTPISTYNGMFYSTIIEDGQVLGLWKRIMKATSMDIVLHPTKPLSQKQIRQLTAQADDYSIFLGKPVQLKIKGKLEIADKGEWGKK